MFVISARNKYKAGVYKLDLKDIIKNGQKEGKMEIERKLEQCPDKEAVIKMVVGYEFIQG